MNDTTLIKNEKLAQITTDMALHYSLRHMTNMLPFCFNILCPAFPPDTTGSSKMVTRP
jgi:hypothetical protein